MGVYIPNISKPKECGECLFFMLDGVITDDNEWISYSVCDLLGKTIGDADMLNDCPLIEIDTDDPELSAFFEQLFPLLAELQRGSQVYDRSTRRKENR